MKRTTIYKMACVVCLTGFCLSWTATAQVNPPVNSSEAPVPEHSTNAPAPGSAGTVIGTVVVDHANEQANEQDNENVQGIDSPAYAAKKSISILEKIFDHVMQQEFDGDYVSESFFSAGCTGYWLPETGVMFSMNVKFPFVLDILVDAEKEKREKPKDLWEQFEKEVEGKKTSDQRDMLLGTPNTEELQNLHRKNDRLQQTVMSILKEYGDKMETSFSPDQKLIVLVESEGGDHLFSSYRMDKKNARERSSGYKIIGTNPMAHLPQDYQEGILKQQQEIQWQQEEIQRQSEEMKQALQKKQNTQIKEQISEESKRARDVAVQVQKQISEAIKMADQYLPKDAEWRKNIPSVDEMLKHIPDADTIQKYIPDEKQLQDIQEKFHWVEPLLGQPMFGPRRIGDTQRMVFEVSFKDLLLAKTNPEEFDKRVKITVY